MVSLSTGSSVDNDPIWFQKPFPANGINPETLYLTKLEERNLTGTPQMGVGIEHKSNRRLSNENDTLKVLSSGFKRPVKRRRISNACYEHRYKHARCPHDCTGRKKDRDLFMASLTYKLGNKDDIELLRGLIIKFIHFDVETASMGSSNRRGEPILQPQVIGTKGNNMD